MIWVELPRGFPVLSVIHNRVQIWQQKCALQEESEIIFSMWLTFLSLSFCLIDSSAILCLQRRVWIQLGLLCTFRHKKPLYLLFVVKYDVFGSVYMLSHPRATEVSSCLSQIAAWIFLNVCQNNHGSFLLLYSSFIFQFHHIKFMLNVFGTFLSCQCDCWICHYNEPSSS